MSKSDFISGSILEFKLSCDLGYAYCKVLDFRNIREFDGVIVKVFDLITKDSLKDITVLNGQDWLFGARRMPWLPGTRGKGAWKIKGILVDEQDKIIPDFKYCIKSNPLVENESLLTPWDIVRNINVYIPTIYSKIKHLEDTVVSPGIAIETRTVMEYCRTRNISIQKCFDLNDNLNRLIYSQMIKVPIYKTIPVEIRGKALGDDNL